MASKRERKKHKREYAGRRRPSELQDFDMDGGGQDQAELRRRARLNELLQELDSIEKRVLLQSCIESLMAGHSPAGRVIVAQRVMQTCQSLIQQARF